MNKQYQELFQLVARNGAITTEQAMETLKSKEDNQKEMETLIEARNEFNVIEDKVLNDEPLTLQNLIRLYAGAVVSRNILEKNVNTWTAIIKEYDDNLIPKLYEVAKETDDEKRNSLMDQFFS